jgi:ankyrin repeat protein
VQGGRFAETPLHWAASSDDVEVARALLDGGADVTAPGACIADGVALDDAVAFGCWNVARLLVERGARVDKLWHAAGLGMMARLQELLIGPPTPTPAELSDAFWQACAGGHRRAAELLFARGADLDWVPHHTKKTPLDAAAGDGTGRQALLNWLRERGARPA